MGDGDLQRGKNSHEQHSLNGMKSHPDARRGSGTIVVIVPGVNRPENAKLLKRALRETGTRAQWRLIARL
jgi:hypothetical protein